SGPPYPPIGCARRRLNTGWTRVARLAPQSGSIKLVGDERASVEVSPYRSSAGAKYPIREMMGNPGWPRGIDPRARYAARLAILCAVYFGLAKAGLALAFTNKSVTSIWPPTGLALAAVLIWGYRMWPAIAVGAFLANITTAGPVGSVLAIAAGNTLEAVAGAFLLRRVAHFRPSLERVRDV